MYIGSSIVVEASSRHAAAVDKAESRLSISEVPQEISRIFFGEPQPRYF